MALNVYNVFSIFEEQHNFFIWTDKQEIITNLNVYASQNTSYCHTNIILTISKYIVWEAKWSVLVCERTWFFFYCILFILTSILTITSPLGHCLRGRLHIIPRLSKYWTSSAIITFIKLQIQFIFTEILPFFYILHFS